MIESIELSDFVRLHFPSPCLPAKRHKCRICGEWIEIRQPCCRWDWLIEGHGRGTSHDHPECYAQTEKWDHGDWESWTPEGPRATPYMRWGNKPPITVHVCAADQAEAVTERLRPNESPEMKA